MTEKLIVDFRYKIEEENLNTTEIIRSPDLLGRLASNTLEEIFKYSSSASKIAVVIKQVSDSTIVDELIFIYDSYINALEKINKYEYSESYVVEVYEINIKGYAQMFHKPHGEICYHRIAGTCFKKYDLHIFRSILFNKASIYESYWYVWDGEQTNLKDEKEN